jgi:predicted amidohydrolase
VRCTVALLQLESPGAYESLALRRGEAALRAAAAAGADVAVLPEVWQLGYATFPAGRALAPDAPFLQRHRELAAELGLAVVVTYLERAGDGKRNAALLVDRHGRDVLRYAKAHVCSFAQEAALTPGDGFAVAELDTAAGPVRTGLMICYDREFPESARALMLAGAELVLVPNACPLTEDRIAQLRSRAFENMMAIATANYAGGEFGGRSCAFDGMPFHADGRPREQCAALAGAREELVLCRLDVAALRAYRRRETWGDAYRRPSLYGALVDREVAEPFARADAPPR